MTLEIASRTVETIGPLQVYEPSEPYALVHQWGYGRMDASTPAAGLATYHLASCTAVVLHCAATGRTTLSHSPNFLYMNTFAPMFDWITGGDGTGTPATFPAWVMGLGAGSPPRHHDVEAVILRGFEYAMPAKAATFGHDGWMADFRRLCGQIKMRGISVIITDAQEPVRSGAFLVDKTSGRITYLKRQGVISQRAGGTAVVRLEDPLGGDSPYSRASTSRDLFMGSLLGERYEPECVDLHLQYDVNHYRSGLPITSEARELLRSKMQGERSAGQVDIIKRYGASRDWINDHTSHSAAILRGILDSYPAIGMPCEVCPLPGPRRCSSCHGAWYCSPEHQKAGWKMHKVWCRDHPHKS